MKLNTLTPNVMVADVNATVDFYRDVLGFALVTSVPESGTLNWAMMKRDDVEIMFQTKPSITEEIPAMENTPVGEGGALTFFIAVEDIEGLHAAIKDRVEIVMPMRTAFYGMREFAFKDCNGFILAFAESVATE